MSLLISDANIFIDLEIGGLTTQLFLLPRTIAVLDVLFEEELRERHSDLLEIGLQVKSVSSELMVNVESLILKYPRPSKMDILALALAVQEQCPLLTGDKALRAAARAESIEVHGMIWLAEIMLAANIVQPADIKDAFTKMKNTGSRLPWEEGEKMLKNFEMRAMSIVS